VKSFIERTLATQIPPIFQDKFRAEFPEDRVLMLLRNPDPKPLGDALVDFITAQMSSVSSETFMTELGGRFDPSMEEEEPLNVGKIKDLLDRIVKMMEARKTDSSSMEVLKAYLGRITNHCSNEFHSRIMYEIGSMNSIMPVYDWLANLSRRADVLCDNDDSGLLFDCKAVLLYAFCEGTEERDLSVPDALCPVKVHLRRQRRAALR
jgi:hypothetical protein